jgi:hypothetical protein
VGGTGKVFAGVRKDKRSGTACVAKRTCGSTSLIAFQTSWLSATGNALPVSPV